MHHHVTHKALQRASGYADPFHANDLPHTSVTERAQELAEVEANSALALRLMREPGGSTVAALCDATGWSSSTLKGFVTRQLNKHHRRIMTCRLSGVISYTLLEE